jgi:hypothetical protein
MQLGQLQRPHVQERLLLRELLLRVRLLLGERGVLELQRQELLRLPLLQLLRRLLVLLLLRLGSPTGEDRDLPTADLEGGRRARPQVDDDMATRLEPRWASELSGDRPGAARSQSI